MTVVIALAGLFAAIFLLHAPPAAGCMSSLTSSDPCRVRWRQLTLDRFAFVEYEDRRDADDAYHEMHNKRIGRDDILKIEVGAYCEPKATSIHTVLRLTCDPVGPYSAVSIVEV
jgi:hypothetical protein